MSTATSASASTPTPSRTPSAGPPPSEAEREEYARRIAATRELRDEWWAAGHTTLGAEYLRRLDERLGDGEGGGR